LDPLKSQVEFYLDLCMQLVRCDPLSICSSRDLAKDLETLSLRTQSEGLSFLTKTLPSLGRALDLGLTTLVFSVPRAFRRAHGNRSIPAFLQAYFNTIFDESGRLREDSTAGAVRHLRQVLFFAYKLEVPFSLSEVSNKIEAFIDVEKNLVDEQYSFPEDLSLDLAGRITEEIFRGFDPSDILPRHGPGAVATGERLEEKWHFARLYNQIHQVFPYYDYYVVGKGCELLDRKDWYKSLERLETGVAKLVAVPKDSRGPRLISSEPLEFQWIQQGIGRKLATFLEEGSNPLPRERINFTRQDINARLALDSSLTGENATLDLSDASDRVSLALVRRVFEKTPRLLRALEAVRTSATLLPSGEVLPLKKFAPMGSAVCFPVEAYIFWVLIVASVVRVKSVPLSVAARRVYVYGDDIVVPSSWASLSIQTLESVGLKVNVLKSCLTGNFRESCGTDAFKHEVVTPARLRKPWSASPGDGTAFAAYVSLANNLFARGYLAASESIWKKVVECYGVIPYGTRRSSFPCRILQNPVDAVAMNRKLRFPWRWNSRYQRIEFKVLSLRNRGRLTELDGWSRMLRNSVFPGLLEPSRVVSPRSTFVKRGWVAVY